MARKTTKETYKWPGAQAILGDPPIAIQEWQNRVLDAMKLTPKQRQIAVLMLKGFPAKEIASIAGNSEKTIKHHVRCIFDKSNTDTRSEFVAEVFCL